MKRSTVKSAGRTMEILELFENERRPLRLHDIYQKLGYPQSSASNLLKSMVMMGYLNYSHVTWTYLPTARVGKLGAWLLSFIYGQRDYDGLIERIQRETDETAVLATQNDLFVQYVSVRQPDHKFKIPPPEGVLRVMTRSSAGLALMSEMPHQQIEKLLRQIHYYELSGEASLDLETTMREINWVKQTGYCLLKESIPGGSSIAFPLPGVHHGIPMAIGVGGTTERISLKQVEIVDIVKKAVTEFCQEGEREDPTFREDATKENLTSSGETNAGYKSLY